MEDVVGLRGPFREEVKHAMPNFRWFYYMSNGDRIPLLSPRYNIPGINWLKLSHFVS